jgi:hypothetical protein
LIEVAFLDERSIEVELSAEHAVLAYEPSPYREWRKALALSP